MDKMEDFGLKCKSPHKSRNTVKID